MATNTQCKRTIDTAARLLKMGHITRAEHDRMVNRARNEIHKNGGARGLIRDHAQRGGYSKDAKRYTAHDEANLNWHHQAGFRRAVPIGTPGALGGYGGRNN